MLKKLTLLSFTLFSVSLNAKDVIIKSLDARSGALIVKTAGEINGSPTLTVKDKVIEVVIPNSHVNSKIEKKINDIVITATQFDRSSVKISAILNKSFAGNEGLISINLKDNGLEVNVPKLAIKEVAKVSPKVARSPEGVASLENDKLDENYLRTLEQEQAQAGNKQKEIEVSKESTDAGSLDKSSHQTDTARASVTQIASVKGTKEASENPKSSFSIAGYVGKFIAFLSLMILGFYGVLTLFKKGVIKKGRLGFLNSTKLVEVLSTTHVAPKRSLMMVKAHKQVFLISNSETGMQLISEIQDVNGLITTGELELTGSNFQSNLAVADKSEKEFKLKEIQDSMLSKAEAEFMSDDFMDETPAAKSIAKIPVKDEVRLSDQIKSKLKSLKQLQ